MTDTSNTITSAQKAFVFPGQGSQSLGMLSELSEQHTVIKDLFTTVSNTLNYDLWALTQTGPLEQLNQTEYTQVAMLTADVAVYRVLEQYGLDARISAGHSLGEYAALVCADALELTDAAKLIQARGRLMQDNVPLGKGAMAAIVGLTDAQVQEACHHASTETAQVTPANYNAIGQVVIAGHTPAVKAAMAVADKMGARLTLEIPISVPCHCSLLSDAALKFQEVLNNTPIKTPKRAVISNVDLSIHDNPDVMRPLLAKQLYSPVRWVETIQAMQQSGITQIIECGPGAVLTGLIKRIDRSISTLSVNTPAHLDKVLSLEGISK
ncbi:MAG: ACP S-malonyltransferase [Gammaproteobacteria bacterium]|nr:ACP S-malonyltransferase [Gammaproteobacteria bacterium]